MKYIRGENFEGVQTEVNQERLDTDSVRAILTPDQLEACTKTLSFTQIKVERKDKSKKPKFQMPNLANATPEGLMDMLGDVREQMKDLKKLEGIYKDALEGRLKTLEDAPVEQIPEFLRKPVQYGRRGSATDD